MRLPFQHCKNMRTRHALLFLCGVISVLAICACLLNSHSGVGPGATTTFDFNPGYWSMSFSQMSVADSDGVDLNWTRYSEAALGPVSILQAEPLPHFEPSDPASLTLLSH